MNDSTAPASQIPMTFGQILDRIYRLMRANLRLFIGIAAVPALASFLIFGLVFAVAFVPIVAQQQSHSETGAAIGLIAPVFLAVILLNLAVCALYLAAAIHAAMQANQGLRTTISEAYSVAWKRGWRYLWLMFLGYLIAFAPILVAELAIAVPMGLLSMNKATPPPAFFLMIPLGILPVFAAMVYGVLVALRLSLAFPASLAEDLTAWAAIRRSGRLTQRAKGRIFLVMLVIYAIAYAAEMAVGIVLMVIFGIGALAVAALHVTLASVSGVIGAVLAGLCLFGFLFLWMALIWAAFATAFAVIYHDQRLRIDGPLPAPAPAGVPA